MIIETGRDFRRKKTTPKAIPFLATDISMQHSETQRQYQTVGNIVTTQYL
jgi:hypothetical protein